MQPLGCWQSMKLCVPVLSSSTPEEKKLLKTEDAEDCLQQFVLMLLWMLTHTHTPG